MTEHAPRLLIVEDDPDISSLIDAWFYERADIRLRHDAGEITDDDVRWADAVLVDYMLPGANGCDILRWVAHRRPEIRRVLWTASGLNDCEHAHRVLHKPTSLTQIMEALRT